MAAIGTKMDQLDELEKLLHSNEGWTSHKHRDHVTVMYKKRENLHIYTIRIEADLQAPLFNILTVLNEVDLYKKWLPSFDWPTRLGLVECERLALLGRVSQVAMPWPFAWR